jgi:hypothetical protein
MNLINDGIGLLLGLAPVAALVALVLAGWRFEIRARFCKTEDSACGCFGRP